MEFSAKAKHIRMSPKKIRLVADVVRGMPVKEVLDRLKFIQKKATVPLMKVIKSAVANAENNFEAKGSNLFLKEIRIDEGVTIKRWMPRARGRATMIRKRNSHINVILGELTESGIKRAKEQKIEAPVKLDDLHMEMEKAAPEEKSKKFTGKDSGAKVGKSKGAVSKFFQRKTGE